MLEKRCAKVFVYYVDYYTGRIELKKPMEVFICFNDSTVVRTSTDSDGLIDYVDFGNEGNKFLESIGVARQPSVPVLAQLLLDRQATYFGESGKDDMNMSVKCDVYISYLKLLAVDVSKLNGEAILKRLRNEPWCLGYQYTDDTDGTNRYIPGIADPGKVYLNNHDICAIKFKPFCVPNDPALRKLYVKFGSKWLSECVTDSSIPVGKSKHFRKLRTFNHSSALRKILVSSTEKWVIHRLDMSDLSFFCSFMESK